MGNKKIDHLFQEHLKSLEVSPKKRVWNNIEAQLTKKKRRVFPFWWFTGTVASILILISIFNPFSSEVNQDVNNKLDEIITTIPKKKNSTQTNIDTLRIIKNSTNTILISKKEDILKVETKKNILSTNNEKKTIQPQKKKTKSIVSSYHTAGIRLNIAQQDFLSSNLKINDFKRKTKKLRIIDVLEIENKSKVKKTLKNWSLAPVFAVLQSNSLTDSSPINSSLASSTSGENSYAYGVQIAYKLNDRWSIQSGIQLQETAYSNTQIGILTSTTSNPFATEFANGVAFSFDTSNANENALLTSDFSGSALVTNTGNLSQNFGYVEIPLEIKYNFLNNKKITTAIVTGFSTLFLNKNEVILNTQNFSRNLEATNLNNVNFSGNLGFDLSYILTEKWSFQVNPMFKIQLNTFTDNANGFAPFNLGIYSGIIYQF